MNILREENILSSNTNANLSLEDIAVCVFTSALNLPERALSVHTTWLRKFPKGYLIGGYYYNPKLKMIALGDGVEEDYQSATKKQFLGLIELHKRFPDSKLYFITGCDAYIFSENLRNLLSEYDYDEDYLIGGQCGDIVINGERVIYPGGGPGFAISHSLVAKISPRLPSFVEEWERTQDEYKSACDAAMAYLLQHEYGVKLTFRDGFYSGPPYDYPKFPYKDGNGNEIYKPVIDHPMAFHGLSIREMYVLDRTGWLRKKTHLDRGFDKISRFFTGKRKTKTIVNLVSRLLYGHRFL